MRPLRKAWWVLGVFVALILALGIGFYLRPVSYFNRLLYVQMDMAGARSRWITVNGIRLHYYDRGPESGEAVVLVHGLGGQAEDWRNLAPYLVRGGFRVITPDLPGFGRSERPADFSYSIPDQAATVVAFMDALGVKQADLGGWSMGGWIAQRIAIDHPDRIRRLMLFNSAGLNENPAWNTALFSPTNRAELDQLDDLLMPHPPQVPGFIADDILRISRGHRWVMRRALDTMLTGRDTTDGQLPQLKMPVLLVWGSEDRIFPLAQGKKMHALIPQSQFEVAEGCGHLAPVQCEEKMGPEVEGFLRK